jgi:hypothetical protein
MGLTHYDFHSWICQIGSTGGAKDSPRNTNVEILSHITIVCHTEGLLGNFRGRHAGTDLACWHFDIAVCFCQKIVKTKENHPESGTHRAGGTIAHDF